MYDLVSAKSRQRFLNLGQTPYVTGILVLEHCLGSAVDDRFTATPRDGDVSAAMSPTLENDPKEASEFPVSLAPRTRIAAIDNCENRDSTSPLRDAKFPTADIICLKVYSRDYSGSPALRRPSLRCSKSCGRKGLLKVEILYCGLILSTSWAMAAASAFRPSWP